MPSLRFPRDILYLHENRPGPRRKRGERRKPDLLKTTKPTVAVPPVRDPPNSWFWCYLLTTSPFVTYARCKATKSIVQNTLSTRVSLGQ